MVGNQDPQTINPLYATLTMKAKDGSYEDALTTPNELRWEVLSSQNIQ